MFMQILNISENSTNEAPVIGIDFGTSNSLAAIAVAGDPKIIHTPEIDKGILPSIVTFNSIDKESHNTIEIKSIKRLLAKNTEEILQIKNIPESIKSLIMEVNGKPLFNINKDLLSPEQIASQILSYLRVQTSQELKTDIKEAVISVPAYFNNSQKYAVINAAKIAGLKVIRLIAEPTAAAYAYGLQTQNSEGTYMVYDLGGGTFDISIIKFIKGILQVKAVAGDNMLGGDDIDFLLAENLLKQANIDKKEITSELLSITKTIKEEISISNNVTKSILFKNKTINLEIDIDNFEKIIEPLINKTIEIAKNLLLETEEKIKGIILVGGSTKIPLIHKYLKNEFQVPLYKDLDPDKVVAYGAALQAENLSSNKKDNIIVDVASLSLGLEVAGGMFDKIIPRNSTIPCSIKRKFTTQIDNQNAIKFNVLQGEREFAKDCHHIASFELQNLPQKPAGTVKVEVTFTLDVNNILSVTAIEENTGIMQEIQIKPTYGLSKEDLQQIIREDYKYTIEDHKNKLLQESILKAKEFIKHFFLISQQKHLLTTYNNHIDEQILKLEDSISQKDTELINTQLQILENITKQVIEEYCNIGISKLLVGKKHDSV